MASETLTAPARQAATVETVSHRPWPLPRRTWVMGQTWYDLLFAHWPVDREMLERFVPRELPVDDHGGRAWLGVTPFVLGGLRFTATPPLPYLSSFPELNVRTYVTLGGKPGVFFLSLDAASRLAVAAARRLYRLPYFLADMRADRSGTAIRYESVRADTRGHPARFRGRYRPLGPVAQAQPGSLEYFLTERYCLYTLGPDREPLRAEIHHPPWPLQPAEATIEENSMPPPGLDVSGEPLFHYAARQDVVIWWLEPTEVSEAQHRKRSRHRAEPAALDLPP